MTELDPDTELIDWLHDQFTPTSNNNLSADLEHGDRATVFPDNYGRYHWVLNRPHCKPIYSPCGFDSESDAIGSLARYLRNGY